MRNKANSGIVILIFLTVLAAIPALSFAKWIMGKDGQLKQAENSKGLASNRRAGSPDLAAIARTRRQIMMLDDLYKTAVVLITEHYVNTPETLSAATASKALFKSMKEKGWHDAKLLGFSDVLFNPHENSPQDSFEKEAKSALLAGAAIHEELVTRGGKLFLRMATPVPVVMEKCVMCHADFENVAGAIGAISYTVPLVE